MSSQLDTLIKKIVDAVSRSNQKKTSSYDTTGTVTRIEGDTAWVHIPGGVDETPVKMTISAKAGDTVQVRVGGGSAWLTGNATAPPTDDTASHRAVTLASSAMKKITNLFQTVEEVSETVTEAADNAVTAMASADGKSTVYHSASAPTGGTYKTGDTWFNSSEGYAIYTWNGSTWVKEELGEDAIADLSITNAKIANGTIQNAKIGTVDAGKITSGTIDTARLNVAGLITAGSLAVTADIPTAVSELTNDEGYQTAQDVSDAIAAIPGVDDAITEVVPIYYRSTTQTTPTISTSTTIGTSASTDNAWEYVMPQPKRDCYFYTCERYVYSDNSVDFSTVRELSSETYASKWVSSSDSTYIDGGKLYAGSVTTNAIDANAITLGKLSSSLQSTINSASSDASSALTAANSANNKAVAYRGTCSTAASTTTKTVICESYSLMEGASVLVYFSYANTATAPKLNVNSTGAKTIYVNGSAASSSNPLKWKAGDTVQFTYDGTYYRASLPVEDFITADGSGIQVHSNTDSNNYLWVTSDGVDVYKAISGTATNVASFGSSIRLGTSGGNIAIGTSFNRIDFNLTVSSVVKSFLSIQADSSDGAAINLRNSGLLEISKDSTSIVKLASDEIQLLQTIGEDVYFANAIGLRWKGYGTQSSINFNLLNLSTGNNCALNYTAYNNSITGTWTNIYGYNIRLYYKGNCYVGATGTNTITSDIRYKKDVDTLPNIYDKVALKLTPKTFRWITDEKDAKEDGYVIQQSDKGLHYGVIAQDVISIYEELGIPWRDHAIINIDPGDEENGIQEHYCINYNEFIPMLIHLCQTQQKEINAIKAIVMQS